MLCAFTILNQKITHKNVVPYTLPEDREDQIERFILQVWNPLTAILLMTTALILTHSRGGFISTLAGGLVLLFFFKKRQGAQSVKSRVAFGGAVLVAIIAFVLTSEVLLKRIDQLTVDSQSRLTVYGITVEAIGDNPLLGFGYGTFTDSFRLYRDERIDRHFGQNSQHLP